MSRDSTSEHGEIGLKGRLNGVRIKRKHFSSMPFYNSPMAYNGASDDDLKATISAHLIPHIRYSACPEPLTLPQSRSSASTHRE